MDSCLPERFKPEAEQIARIWIDTGAPIEKIIEEHASPEYKKYFMEKRERDRRLKRRGIIEN